MCILFVAMKQHPDYPLIIAANRDEFRSRPTAEMAWWKNKDILAGQDLEANGTWLGLTSHGQFSALTNYRLIPAANIEIPHSRGDLVLKALEYSKTDLESYLKATPNKYQGFNLLYGNAEQLSCFDNINFQFKHFTHGFFSLSNGAINDIWPKMAKGEQALENYVKQSGDIEHKALLNLLKDNTKAPENLLPKTGLSLDWEQKLSSIFIEGKEYGTRSSCVITLNSHNEIKVTEVSYSTMGTITSQQQFNWQL